MLRDRDTAPVTVLAFQMIDIGFGRHALGAIVCTGEGVLLLVEAALVQVGTLADGTPIAGDQEVAVVLP